MTTTTTIDSKKAWFLKPDVCTPCGGKCCKTMPGCAYPEDFTTAELLASAVRSGRYAIDWWIGDARPGHAELDRTLYVRPATKGNEGQRADPSWGGECTFLTPKGCELPPVSRPTECLALEPMSGRHNCVTHGGRGKQQAAVAWIERAAELQQLLNEEK